MELGRGDEVITTPMTFCATVNAAILHVGAVPVMADIDSTSPTLVHPAIEAALTERTKAIMPVHFSGLPCTTWMRFGPLPNGIGCLLVVEDAAAIVVGLPGTEDRFRGQRCGLLQLLRQ